MKTGEEFIKVSLHRIERGRKTILHCLEQLSDEEVWLKIDPVLNSVGIIINHICGNARQWIISGVGGTGDTRNRPTEFTDDNKLNKNQLTEKFGNMIKHFNSTIKNLKEERLLENIQRQGLDKSVMDSIYSTVVHLELHAGQITMLTHYIKKDEYIPTHEYKGDKVVKRNC
jgi:uncharacterized damage-inducible protein DinB